MGIAEKYGIEVRRWREGKWVATHHDGSKDFKTAAEMGFSGNHPDDWAIERLKAGRVTYIPHDDMYATGTLWHFDGTDWHHIYRRSQGLKKPEYLEELKESSVEGDILVESGDAEELTIYDKEGVRYALSPQIAAVFDENSGYEQAPDFTALPDTPREEQVDSAVRNVALTVDNIISKRKNLASIGAEWANYKPGDPVTKNMARALLKVLEESNPSPTPGTTAINDYVSLTNDIVSGKIDSGFQATGVDDKGKASSDAVPDITYCKLVSETLAGCGAVYDGVLQLRTMLKAENLAPGTKSGEKQVRGELNTALASYELDVGKGVANLFTATDKVINLVDKSSQAAQATSTVATVAIAPVASVISLLTFARHTRKAIRAGSRWRQYKKLLKDSKVQPYHPDLQACMQFLIGKSKRRMRTQASTAATAIISASGSGILTVTAIVGGANAWNPVGWTLLGVAAVGGVGIVSYKLYKRWTREKRHAKRLQKYRGVEDAATAANKLVSIYKSDLADRDKDAAGLILESFGVYLPDLARPDGVKVAMALVKRHLEK